MMIDIVSMLELSDATSYRYQYAFPAVIGGSPEARGLRELCELWIAAENRIDDAIESSGSIDRNAGYWPFFVEQVTA